MTEGKKIIAVIAESLKQFLDFVRGLEGKLLFVKMSEAEAETEGAIYIYVDKPERVDGLDLYDYIFVGRYWENANRIEISMACASRMTRQ